MLACPKAVETCPAAVEALAAAALACAVALETAVVFVVHILSVYAFVATSCADVWSVTFLICLMVA